MVEFPYVHRENAGCQAITQQPLRSSAQTRLYLYCYVVGRELHLICAGDKESQARDNKFCSKYVEVTGLPFKAMPEDGKEVTVRPQKKSRKKMVVA